MTQGSILQHILHQRHASLPQSQLTTVVDYSGLMDRSILNYDPSSGQYGVYFPSDHQTIYIHPDDKDM